MNQALGLLRLLGLAVVVRGFMYTTQYRPMAIKVEDANRVSVIIPIVNISYRKNEMAPSIGIQNLKNFISHFCFLCRQWAKAYGFGIYRLTTHFSFQKKLKGEPKIASAKLECFRESENFGGWELKKSPSFRNVLKMIFSKTRILRSYF